MNSMRASRDAHNLNVRRPAALSAKEIGRPRDAQIDKDVVAAVLNALQERGYGGVTINGIAKSIGRARSSLYRRWSSKRHLVAYAVVSALGENPAEDTGTLRGDLYSVVTTFWRALQGPLGQALAGLVADMAQYAALASSIRKVVLAPRRRSMREAIERARSRGEACDDIDVELLLDMLTAPFYFRTLFGHASMSLENAAQIVNHVLRLIEPQNLARQTGVRSASRKTAGR